MMVLCKNCEYCLVYKDELSEKYIGECRKNPPNVERNGIGYWPLVKNILNQGCYSGKDKSTETLLNNE